MSDAQNADLEGMVGTLRENGYMVFKVPVCKIEGPHGRHAVITRTAHCEGKEPIPHGYHSSNMGSFGMWVNCQCGRSFSDCSSDPTPWERHKAEFIDGGQSGRRETTDGE